MGEEHPKGTIIFTTIGRPQYGFDIFTINLTKPDTEHRLTDGISVNFNGQFIDDDKQTVVHISERAGSPRIYLTRPGTSKPETLPFIPDSLFHDRPVIMNNRLYFVSAHEYPNQPFKSWSAVYSTGVLENKTKITRLTPYGSVDYSPAVSKTGKFIAVASYGSRPWGGEFHELNTDIVVFGESDRGKRVVVCEKGGWPTWSGDSTIYFHHQADDGWWSIYRAHLPENGDFSEFPVAAPVRVTPPGLHCFTPAAFHDGRRIAVATRRCGKNFRHIEIFDLETKTFQLVTENVNPNFHHYNPFVSPNSGFLGYHRFRGESSFGDSTIPHLEPVMSPFNDLHMLRLNGNFPAPSPEGDLIALNSDFNLQPGVKVIRSDGSKQWTLIKDCIAFHNSWSPTEKNVVYTSIGPIFHPVKTTVQIARITFNPVDLTDDCDEIPCGFTVLTKEDAGNNAFPSCSPDGKSLVFRSGRSGYKNLYIVDAVNGEFDGGIRQLTKGPWIDTMPNWSPTGEFIAFSSNMHNPSNAECFSIYIVKPDGSGLRRVYVAGPEGSVEADRERINHVCFNRDGKWLLFASNIGGVTAEPVSWPNQFQPYGDLFVIRLDGSGLRRLTWSGYENGTPAWHTEDELELGRLGLSEKAGEKLVGQFSEPLWISCDI